jgi:ribonucleoside-diphosphate reductase alpha chain
LGRGEIIRVNDDVVGKKRKLITGCGSLHCIALFDPHTGALLEIYLSKGSTGGCNNFMIGLSRMISISARGGVDIYTIIDQLNSTGSCPSYTVRRATKGDTSKGSCCPMAVGNALLDMYNEVQEEIARRNEKTTDQPLPKKPKPRAVTPIAPALQEGKAALPEEEESGMACPQCGEELIFEGGCNICKSCGWSRCH